MKKRNLPAIRIAILIVLTTILGIGMTIYQAVENNSVVSNYGYANYGFYQKASPTNTQLTMSQIMIIFILLFFLIASILYLVYSHFGKTDYKELLKEEEKVITYLIESFLCTILLTLIITFCTNYFLLKDTVVTESNTTTQNQIHYQDTKIST